MPARRWQHIKLLSQSSSRAPEPAGGPQSGEAPAAAAQGAEPGAAGAAVSEPHETDATKVGPATSEAVPRDDATGDGNASEPLQPTSRVLWEARPLAREFEQTERALAASAALTGGGLGLALLGVAPFCPPNPFMVGLLLAVAQVRLAHVWLTRMVRAQVRRHVTEVTQTGELAGDAEAVVSVKCDGGLQRTLRLKPPSDSETSPSFANVVQQGATFILLDRTIGTSESPKELEAVLESDWVIFQEELSVVPFDDESKEEAERVVQRFSALSRDHLKRVADRAGSTPVASLAQVTRVSQSYAAVVVACGLMICVSGRRAADSMLSQAEA